MPHFAAMMNEERVSNCLFRYFLSQLHSSADTEWTHALLEMKCILKSTGWCKTSLDSSLDFPLFVSQNLLLPHFSLILDGFVTACVSVICPWQETHLWLIPRTQFPHHWQLWLLASQTVLVQIPFTTSLVLPRLLSNPAAEKLPHLHDRLQSEISLSSWSLLSDRNFSYKNNVFLPGKTFLAFTCLADCIS